MFNVHEHDRSKSILPLKKQEIIRDNFLKERLDSVLKEAMVKADIPMWIVISKEYNEDPVVETLTPCEHDSSRRLSIFVFVLHQEIQQIERYVIGSPHPALKNLYTFIWDRNKETQWQRLKKLVEEKQPSKIGINYSKHIAVADGLTSSLHDTLSEELGSKWVERFVSAEHLVIHWFLKRSKEEMLIYPFLADLTSNLAKTALSNEVIYPGLTTTTEVVDWIRQRVNDLGIKTSFYPTIDIQRQHATIDRLTDTIIMPGDIVHLDFGLDYLGLCTDTQQLAYVLKRGETKPPEGLEAALRQALVFEDIVMGNMTAGRRGNQVFEKSIQDANKSGINAMLYTHPVGRHCHEAGPIIGLFDQQTKIPFKGELEIVSDSAYALEFNVKAYIPEWGHEIYLYLEQPIAVYQNGSKYLTPRQDYFYLIR
ncbi:M24 family metallopeptidase [Bacillus suaedaesalsae]|uniref:M24 family metallopeptidase n=1 Tax=Bacillus suaedaesalsae TaxID=2810349 RepID=A0ABS2DFQ7_9BACI|nr:M24 family metallopeptidase [Bacillus suaedaesalsae]MBM6617315.1 M24 family metallopeptidase [Bacillus suaedaesalsae]